jgi:hypothetical protein
MIAGLQRNARKEKAFMRAWYAAELIPQSSITLSDNSLFATFKSESIENVVWTDRKSCAKV